MLGVAPISARLIDQLPQVGPARTVGGQEQFQQSLAQPVALQSAVTPSSSIPPTSEVSRAASRVSSLGERILQNLSAVHRADGAKIAAAKDATGAKALRPGPAEQALTQPRMAEKAPDNFDAMIAALQSSVGNVIQVALISKSAGSFSSSLNKLMSAG